MDEQTVNKFKKILLEEKAKLEAELSSVGHINKDNPKDWESDPGDAIENKGADTNVRADNIEDYENRTAILKQLEIQLGDVNNALEKIEKGTYGICETSGEVISPERLEANPSARTCKDHM